MSNIQFQDVAINLATAQAFSVATSAVAMGNSISLLMENAVSHEKNSQATPFRFDTVRVDDRPGDFGGADRFGRSAIAGDAGQG